MRGIRWFSRNFINRRKIPKVTGIRSASMEAEVSHRMREGAKVFGALGSAKRGLIIWEGDNGCV